MSLIVIDFDEEAVIVRGLKSLLFRVNVCLSDLEPAGLSIFSVIVFLL